MTEERKVHPLENVAKWKIEQATNNGGHKAARWDATGKFWRVSSATRKGVEHHVRLKQTDRHLAEQRATLNRPQRTGFGWLFTLQCDCEAAQSGLFCWHLGAVRLWWSYHHALSGDQVAERNLRSRKQKDVERTEWAAEHPNAEQPDDGPSFSGVEDEWLGAGYEPAMRQNTRVWYSDRQEWGEIDPDGSLANGGVDSVRKMLHNTASLLEGGGK